jgi:uncharacterized protein YodC (DUF2158 family)
MSQYVVGDRVRDLADGGKEKAIVRVDVVRDHYGALFNRHWLDGDSSKTSRETYYRINEELAPAPKFKEGDTVRLKEHPMGFPNFTVASVEIDYSLNQNRCFLHVMGSNQNHNAFEDDLVLVSHGHGTDRSLRPNPFDQLDRVLRLFE